jgi:hypothetical protein
MRWAAYAFWKAAEANREVRNGARSRAAGGSQVTAAQAAPSLCHHSVRIGHLTYLSLRGGNGRSLDDGERAGAQAQRHGRTWASVDNPPPPPPNTGTLTWDGLEGPTTTWYRRR